MRTGRGNQAVDALHVPLGNFCYVSSPLLPIPLVTDFLYHAGVNGVLEFLQLRKGKLYGFCLAVSSGNSVTRICSRAVTNTADQHGAATGRLMAVKLNFVDRGAEPVIVRTQCVEYRPDYGKTLVVVERFFRRDISGDEHRNDDITELLARRSTHDAPNGLHHVDLGVAR